MAALALLLIVQAAADVLNAPSFVWNEIRVARSAALVHGYSLYLDKDAPGPVIGTLHTPVSHWIYLGITVFHDPAYLIIAGSLLTMLLVFVPLVWVLRRASRDGLASAIAFLFCGFLILQTPGTFHIATMIHTDAAALAFATLACGIFANSRRPITLAQAWIAGAACAMAVGCKQTIAPIVLALTLYLAVTAGLRTLAHFAAALAAAGTVLLAIIFALVRARAFLFNTVTLAAHRPLKPGYLELLVRSFREGKLDALPAIFPIVLLTVCAWNGWRQFTRDNRWLVFALAAISLIPVTFKAIITVGSDVNHMGFVHYFFFAAAGLAIEQYLAGPGNSLVRAIAWTCAILGTLVSIAPGAALSLPSRLRHLRDNPPEAALNYELRHPDTAYFPLNPLATLLSTGKVYHVDYSIYDRELAGYPLTQRQFNSGLPARFEMVAIPPGEIAESTALRMLLKAYLPAADPELPGWTVYRPRLSAGSAN